MILFEIFNAVEGTKDQILFTNILTRSDTNVLQHFPYL